MTWDQVWTQLRAESLRLAEHCQSKGDIESAGAAFAAFAIAEGIAKFAAETPGVADGLAKLPVDTEVAEALAKFTADARTVVEASTHPPLPARALRHG